MKFVKSVAAAVVLASCSIAVADPILMDTSYQLENHPDGNAAAPYYGLRLDGLLSGDSADIYTFDFEAAGAGMNMFWDSSTGDLRIWGNALGGQDVGTQYLAGTTDIWAIDFTYTGVVACGTGICSSSGSGTVVSGLFGSFDLDPVGAQTYGYTFQMNSGHRSVDGLSGWGWMNHCPSVGNKIDGGASCDTHLYSSDWLFTASKVPEPATLALFGMGIIGIGLSRRRKPV